MLAAGISTIIFQEVNCGCRYSLVIHSISRQPAGMQSAECSGINIATLYPCVD